MQDAAASPFTGTGQEISLQIVIGYLIVTTMEWLKERQWFPWLTPYTDKVNRIVGATAAFLYSIGIHYQFDSAAGMLVISGLSMEPLIDGLRGFVMQQLMYRGAIEKPKALEAVTTMKKSKQPRRGKKIGALLLVGVLGLGTMACGGKVPLQTTPEQKRAVQEQIVSYADLIQRAGEIVEQGQLIEIAAFKDGHISQATHIRFQQRLLDTSRAVIMALDKAKQFAQAPEAATILKTALSLVDATLLEDIGGITVTSVRDRLGSYFKGARALLDALVKIPSVLGGTGDLDEPAAVWQRLEAAALAQ